MISVALIAISAVAGLMLIGASMAVEDTGEARYAWASLTLLTSTMTLSFIAGVLS